MFTSTPNGRSPDNGLTQLEPVFLGDTTHAINATTIEPSGPVSGLVPVDPTSIALLAGFVAGVLVMTICIDHRDHRLVGLFVVVVSQILDLDGHPSQRVTLDTSSPPERL